MNSEFDLYFIEAVLVGIYVARALKRGVPLHKDMKKFVKELFSYRLLNVNDDDGQRYLAFDDLIKAAQDDIKNSQ